MTLAVSSLLVSRSSTEICRLMSVNMSSQTIKEHLPISGVGTAKAASWLTVSWKKVLSHKTKLILGGGALAVLALAGYYFWGGQSGTPQYMTARVERGSLRNTVTATGTLQAVTTVQVGSQASGTISALNADFNSVVKKGQVIAQVDPSVAQAHVQQSRANLENAKASLAQARAAVNSSRAGTADAQAKLLAAQSTVQNQQSGVSAAQANVAVLKAERDDAQSALNQQQQLAAAGVIAKRDLEIAQTAF